MVSSGSQTDEVTTEVLSVVDGGGARRVFSKVGAWRSRRVFVCLFLFDGERDWWQFSPGTEVIVGRLSPIVSCKAGEKDECYRECATQLEWPLHVHSYLLQVKLPQKAAAATAFCSALQHCICAYRYRMQSRGARVRTQGTVAISICACASR